MTKGKLLLILMVLGTLGARGQSYIYSLNQYTPIDINPAYAAADSDASITFVNRRTKIAPGVDYHHNVFSGEYPVIDRKTGRRYGGIGVNFAEKDAGSSNLLKTYAMGLSLAYNLPIMEKQRVNFGIQTNYYNMQASFDNMTTGTQWIAHEFRFDPDAALGEPAGEGRINYFGVNAGLMWHLKGDDGAESRAFVGLAAFNLNKPDDSFFEGQHHIPVSYLAQAGAVAYQTQRVQLSPRLIYQRQHDHHEWHAQLSTKVFFSNENPYDIIRSGYVELLSKYDLNNNMAFGIVVSQPDFSLGFSYNFPSSGEAQYFRAGTEFGLKLSKTIWKPRPKTIVIDNKSVGAKRNFDFEKEQKNADPVAGKSDTDIIRENIEALSEVRAVQFRLEKDFKFEFGRTELNNDAKRYLDDLYELLNKHPEYQLEIIGHTDNVGKPMVNYRLLQGRAGAVAAYLQEKGFAEERVKYSGMGDTQPVADNDTEENRAKNRRVEFIIYVNR